MSHDSELRIVHLRAGEVHASGDAIDVRTVLGSCIAVCLHDPERNIGGVNHYMLPGGESSEPHARYGVHAMDVLIGKLQRLGAKRRALVAKVFGGASVLQIGGDRENVAHRNVQFADAFLADEGIPIIARDTGGNTPRRLHFETRSGRVRVQRLRSLQPERVPEHPPDHARGAILFFAERAPA